MEGFRKTLVGTHKGPIEEHVAIKTSTDTDLWPSKIKYKEGLIGKIQGCVEDPLVLIYDPSATPIDGDRLTVLFLVGQYQVEVGEEDVEAVFETKTNRGSPIPADHSIMLLCCHYNRDRKCGVLGPKIIAAVEKYLDDSGHRNTFTVYPCSHIGGHKFAGVSIVYRGGVGACYGMITPKNCLDIVKHYTEDGPFPTKCWRGVSTLSPEECIERASSCSFPCRAVDLF